MSVEFPSGAVPLDSQLYVERPPIESLVCRELVTPGTVIRIRAPNGMGKGSLLLRMLRHAESLDYSRVKIDFQSADQSIYESLSRFLRWFCANVSTQLGLPSRLDDYWDEDIGAKLSCTLYFEDYLLEACPKALVLALSRVEQIFEHAAIAKDFLPMLRFWHEQGKQTESFQRLRLIVSHSTEIYVPLNINQSPFNVGLPVQLPSFTAEQVQDLAKRHELPPFSPDGLNQLMQMLGGHPHLVRTALYHLSTGQMSLQQQLQSAPTQAGIFAAQLQNYLSVLNKQPDLSIALRLIVTGDEAAEIDPMHAYRLNSLGLITPQGDRWKPSCDLYRHFFATQLFATQHWETSNASPGSLQQLQQENERLKQLVHLDELTQIANRRYFDQQLQKEWDRMLRKRLPISLLILDVDYFKRYNDTYGHMSGDHCLYQVAQAIQSCSRRSSDFAARYGGEEFVVLLPQADRVEAQRLAQVILDAVRALKIPHCTSEINSDYVTVSVGVATMCPANSGMAADLLSCADMMLYRAKQEGRDRAAVSLGLGSMQQTGTT